MWADGGQKEETKTTLGNQQHNWRRQLGNYCSQHTPSADKPNLSLFRVSCDVAASSWHVHYLIAHVKEHLSCQWLSKEVGDVVFGGHERHAKFAVLDAFAYEVVTTLSMCLVFE